MNRSAARPPQASSSTPDPAPLTRRARKRNERRDRLYTVAISLFMEQGYDETSMDEIAHRCGLARTTVFNHFPRKAALLDEWALRRRQHAADAIAGVEQDRRSLPELLGDYFGALAKLNAETRDETKTLMLPGIKNSNTLLGHLLGNELAELVSTHGSRLRSSATPEQVGHLLALGYYSAVVRWIHHEPPQFSLDQELSALVDTVLSGALAD